VPAAIAGRAARAWRVRVDDADVAFVDRLQGPQRQHLGREVGDFVVKRADGLCAYQLAVVVDDADQGITDVVRGADLLLSTPRQILLQRALGVATPRYAHVPLVLDGEGRKLSKSLDAAPVDPDNPLTALTRAWALLGQPPARTPGLDAFWQHAISSWRIEHVPATTAVALIDRDPGH
jgi:glutamyl-Q tRNA(Asp) synthetase